MDSEAISVPTLSSQKDALTKSVDQGGIPANDAEDPYSIRRSSVALLGVIIAIATIGVPLMAVVTGRLQGRESMVPTVLEVNGSKSSPPVSFTRSSKSGG